MACRTTSPLAASQGALAIRPWRCHTVAPSPADDGSVGAQICPSRATSSRASARASACTQIVPEHGPRLSSTDGAQCEGRDGDRWPARACRVSARQMREGTERLLEAPHGLAVGRPRHGLLPRLPAVHQGLVPHLAPQGMVGQAFDLLGYPVGSERSRASTMRAWSTRRRS